MPPTSGLQGWGTPAGSLAGFPGRVSRSNTLRSSPAPLVLESLSHLPLLLSWEVPPTPTGPTQPGGRFGDWGMVWELSKFPGPEWAGPTASAPFLLLPSWRVPPTCLSSSPLTSLLCPQDPCSLVGTSEGVGPGPRARQTFLDD